jgi:hypothetical protein
MIAPTLIELFKSIHVYGKRPINQLLVKTISADLPVGG